MPVFRQKVLSKPAPIDVKVSKDMNATIGIIELVVPVLFSGLTLSLGVIMWALSNAPEGYEDAKGFHSKQSPRSVSHSPDISLLHPRNAS